MGFFDSLFDDGPQTFFGRPLSSQQPTAAPPAGGGDSQAAAATASPPPYDGPYPYPHNYGPITTKVCDTSSSSCTLGNVFDTLRRCPQPEYCDQAPVETGQTTKVGGLGDVEHEVCPDDFTVTNNTTPGHWLYPGQVTHRVVERDGAIWIETTGTGRNANQVMSSLNQHVAEMPGNMWEELHRQIIENYRNMYDGGRKPSPWDPNAP